MNNEHKSIGNNIRKVAFSLLGLLVILFIYLSYIQVFNRDFLVNHPLNRRTQAIARHTQLGTILDRHGEKLAYSEKDGTNFVRKYPYGRAAAHVVGYDSSKYGKSGIEGNFDQYLTGLNQPLRNLGAAAHLMKAPKGSNVVLTLDASLQQLAYRALGDRRGAVIVMSPRTGAILAMASTPAFDPNRLDEQWQTISQRQDSPLLDRTVQGLYPPGSILKVMIADAALTEKITTLSQTVQCDGTLNIPPDYIMRESNHAVHGKVNLEEALTVSCNVTFGSLALELGGKRLAKTFERYGFSQPLRTDFAETPSRLPEFTALGRGDLAQTGIGQGSLLVTPLRMAMMVSALANKGIIMKPYLVERITDADGNILKSFRQEEWLKPTTPQLAALISKMMVSAVENGTGSGAFLRGAQVAGKTGTAENPHGEPHAWFAGFAPADDPQIAIVVIVENAGAGGSVAAPIARRILAEALN